AACPAGGWSLAGGRSSHAERRSPPGLEPLHNNLVWPSKWIRVTGSRIFDLRRGDHDDNRTSPHGGNVRSLIITAALEFNYLKASIGFLTLIVAPALLVVVVPSLVCPTRLLRLELAL